MAKMYFVDPTTGEVVSMEVKTSALETRASQLGRGVMVNRFYYKETVPSPFTTYMFRKAKDYGWKYFVTYLGEQDFTPQGTVAELRSTCNSLSIPTKDGSRNLKKAELQAAIADYSKREYVKSMIAAGTPVGWVGNHAFTCMYKDGSGNTKPCPSCASRAKTKGACKHVLAAAEKLELHNPLLWYGMQLPFIQKKFYSFCQSEWADIFEARGHDKRYASAYMPKSIPLPQDGINGEVHPEEVQRNKELQAAADRKASVPTPTRPTEEAPPVTEEDEDLMAEIVAMAQDAEVVLEPVAAV